eukprot:c43361_g1_i1 orf=3-185(-)
MITYKHLLTVPSGYINYNNSLFNTCYKIRLLSLLHIAPKIHIANILRNSQACLCIRATNVP